MGAMVCFNSLQTGKHICTYDYDWQLSAGAEMFQFPSNGKAYMHDIRKSKWDHDSVWVSIPFKRESIYARRSYQRNSRHLYTLCFNSLQTGKHICTDSYRDLMEALDECFNSLQTGKHICTETAYNQPRHTEVSIPFKRESIYAPF